MGELRCAKSVCLPFVLNAAPRCVRRHAGHVTEQPRLGFPFAKIAAAEVNYSCVQIGHAILRRHPITGAVQRGNSVTHSVADATRNWCFDSGRPAELNNLQRAACRPIPRSAGSYRGENGGLGKDNRGALSHFTGCSCACANLLLGARKWTPF